jgi:hypothetical protein
LKETVVQPYFAKLLFRGLNLIFPIINKRRHRYNNQNDTTLNNQKILNILF